MAFFEHLWSLPFWRRLWRFVPRRVKAWILRFGLWHLTQASELWRMLFMLASLSRADYHLEIDRVQRFALRWSISLEQLRQSSPQARIAALLEQAAHEMLMIDDDEQALALGQLIRRYRPFGDP